MNKLKSLFLKIKASLTIGTYRRPLFFVVLLFVVVSLVIVLAATFIGLYIDSEYFKYSFIKALTHFASCMLTPNTFVRLTDVVEEHIWVVVLSAVVIIVEWVLFSGSVIATLTSLVRNYINRKGNAKGKLNLNGHFVILNWNSEVPDLIYNLMLKGYRHPVLILSQRSKDEVRAEIDSLLSVYRQTRRPLRKLKLVVKTGDPLLGSDLEDSSITKARHIVVMACATTTASDARLPDRDLNSLKVLLALGNYTLAPDCDIVIETESDEAQRKMKQLLANLGTLSGNDIIPASFNNKIGQILAQTLLEPRMADLYGEVLSFNGYEFYPYPAEDVEHYLAQHTDGIPVVRQEQLVVFAKTQRGTKRMRNAPRPLDEAERLPMLVPPALPMRDLFVLGKNKKSGALTRNLNLAKKAEDAHLRVKYYEKAQVDALVEDVRHSAAPHKTVLVLADDATEDNDTSVFVNLIDLKSSTDLDAQKVEFVAEVANSKNSGSIRNLRVETVVQSRYLMGLLLSRIALNAQSRKFYDNLLTVDSEQGGEIFDIKVAEAAQLLDYAAMGAAGRLNKNGCLRFADRAAAVHAFYRSSDGRYMLLGYRHLGVTTFVADAQDVKRDVCFAPQDELIYIKY